MRNRASSPKIIFIPPSVKAECRRIVYDLNRLAAAGRNFRLRSITDKVDMRLLRKRALGFGLAAIVVTAADAGKNFYQACQNSFDMQVADCTRATYTNNDQNLVFTDPAFKEISITLHPNRRFDGGINNVPISGSAQWPTVPQLFWDTLLDTAHPMGTVHIDAPEWLMSNKKIIISLLRNAENPTFPISAVPAPACTL